MISELEEEMAWQMDVAGIPPPIREYKFALKLDPPRQWRFDFAWELDGQMSALEIEGGTWAGGRHVSGKGFESDCDKYNAACLLGWGVYRVTGSMVKDGRALELMQRVFDVCNSAEE